MEITPQRLFNIGFWCFLAMGVFNTLSLKLSYDKLDVFAVLASLTNIFFQFIVALSFLYLLKQMQPVQEQVSDTEIQQLIKEAKNGHTRRSK